MIGLIRANSCAGSCKDNELPTGPGGRGRSSAGVPSQANSCSEVSDEPASYRLVTSRAPSPEAPLWVNPAPGRDAEKNAPILIFFLAILTKWSINPITNFGLAEQH